ncbi:MAG: glycosyltransferase [Bacteroidales bacterium]|nr:glycosyltransferase [Bacteroidales bacterium]
MKYRIHYFKFKSFFSPFCYLNLYSFAKFLREEKIDIVQTQFRDSNILGIVAARLSGIDTIIASRRNEGYWLNRRELFILKMLNPYVSGFIANSNSIKNHIENIEGIPQQKIAVIYNGIDLSKFKRKKDFNHADLRKRLGLNINDTVIVMVANLRPVKGIDTLIRAAKLTISEHPRMKFIIVGEGDERGRLTQLIKNLDLLKHVLLLGKRDDIPQILNLSNIGVLTSNSEGLSNSIIEYMAAGLPIVCTDVGGNGELVRDGENGFLVPPENPQELTKKLIKLIDDSELAKKMADFSGRYVQEQFSLNVFLKKTEDFYYEFIS